MSEALVLFASATCVSPGPANTLVMQAAIEGGLMAALRLVAGLAVSFQLMLTAGVALTRVAMPDFGLAALALHLVGAAYLLSLAWPSRAGANGGAASKMAGFSEGLALNFVNPKAWMMVIGAAALAPQIALPWRVLSVCAVFLAAGVISAALWISLGASVQRFVSGNWGRRFVDVAVAVALLWSAATLLVEAPWPALSALFNRVGD